MRRFAIVASFCFATFSCSRGPEFPYQDARLGVDKRVADLLPRMTGPEKRDVLHGRAISRWGIPALKVLTNGPPSGLALAATWDPKIVAQFALAHPSGFGAYGEEPWLASRMAVAWTGSIQGAGIIGAMRDFRCTGDARTQNETEFPPYRAAVEEAGLWAVSQGGCPEASVANTLDKDWGFRGFILEPGDSVAAGANPDDAVRRALRAMFAEGWFDPTPAAKPAPVDGNRIERIAAEEGVVLLQNDNGVLPIYAGRVRSIAVVGTKEQVNAIRARAGMTSVTEGTDGEVKIAFEPRDAAGGHVSVHRNDATALLEAWGSAQGATDVIFGDVNPSGKLPVTEPPFPFGFGLSYTTFDWSDLRIFPPTPRYSQLVQVVVKVRNTGARAGAEVVEVYIHQVKSSVERPAQELKAFQRVELKAGETRDVALTLDHHSMSFYDPSVQDWAAEPGVFEVWLGSSSRDIRLKGSFRLFP